MPHRIDIDGISRNLFVLRHLAVGSRPVCQGLRIDRSDEGDKPFGWNYYLGWLKFIVSQTLIETAIKVRIMQDFLKADPEDGTDLVPIESKINAVHVVGHFVPDLSPLPIREACNKIIHASEVTLVWIDASDDEGMYEFWNGTVTLDGCRGADPWSCQLYTAVFCTALDEFLLQIEEKVDWHHIYKYDEWS
jgi:hypothetical protein